MTVQRTTISVVAEVKRVGEREREREEGEGCEGTQRGLRLHTAAYWIRRISG